MSQRKKFLEQKFWFYLLWKNCKLQFSFIFKAGTVLLQYHKSGEKFDIFYHLILRRKMSRYITIFVGLTHMFNLVNKLLLFISKNMSWYHCTTKAFWYFNRKIAVKCLCIVCDTMRKIHTYISFQFSFRHIYMNKYSENGKKCCEFPLKSHIQASWPNVYAASLESR